MPEIAPFTERDNIKLKGGHLIKRSVVELFTPWCAFCKVTLHQHTMTNEQSAVSQLDMHIRMVHSDRS